MPAPSEKELEPEPFDPLDVLFEPDELELLDESFELELLDESFELELLDESFELELLEEPFELDPLEVPFELEPELLDDDVVFDELLELEPLFEPVQPVAPSAHTAKQRMIMAATIRLLPLLGFLLIDAIGYPLQLVARRGIQAKHNEALSTSFVSPKNRTNDPNLFESAGREERFMALIHERRIWDRSKGCDPFCSLAI